MITSLLAAATTKPGGSIFDPIAKPIAALLSYIYAVIPNYGVAIMILSVVWMILISPLTLKSTRSMLAMQKLQPQLKKLQDQHKNDKQAFAQAQMDLFREHNVSPFGSCLPMLLPLPVFFALFKVIDGLSHFANGVASPKYLSPTSQMYKDIVHAGGHLNAFGMDLAKSPLSHHTSVLNALPYWLVLLVMAGTSYLQSAQMMSRNPAAMQNNPQMKIMRYMPLLFALFCMRFPAGVIVYYAMSNICRIVQQDAMYRFDPKVKALVAKEVVEVEERTSEIDDRERERRNRPGYTPPRSALNPAPAPGADPPTGRMRFRDLWAAAAEQQKSPSGRPPAKPPNGNGSARPPGGATRSTNGAATNGAGPAGRPPHAGRPANRNRKRRGR